MSKKTYKTHYLKGLQVLLFDESGRTIEVDFKGGALIDSTAKFSTSDEKIQRLLEKCSSFNRDFYLESERNDSSAAAPVNKAEEAPSDATEHETTGEIVKVSDKSEAIEWLKEHFPDEGYTSVKLRSMSAVNEAAKKHGVVFDIASE